jgi:hypothetical protein
MTSSDAAHVGVETKNRRTVRRVVRAHSLEDARAVVQPVRGDVNLRVVPGYQLAIHPNAIAFRKRRHVTLDGK